MGRSALDVPRFSAISTFVLACAARNAPAQVLKLNPNRCFFVSTRRNREPSQFPELHHLTIRSSRLMPGVSGSGSVLTIGVAQSVTEMVMVPRYSHFLSWGEARSTLNFPGDRIDGDTVNGITYASINPLLFVASNGNAFAGSIRTAAISFSGGMTETRRRRRF